MLSWCLQNNDDSHDYNTAIIDVVSRLANLLTASGEKNPEFMGNKQ